MRLIINSYQQAPNQSHSIQTTRLKGETYYKPLHVICLWTYSKSQKSPDSRSCVSRVASNIVSPLSSLTSAAPHLCVGCNGPTVHPRLCGWRSMATPLTHSSDRRAAPAPRVLARIGHRSRAVITFARRLYLLGIPSCKFLAPPLAA